MDEPNKPQGPSQYGHLSALDVDSILHTFRVELPDPDIDLFHQQIGEKTFTLFKKLPTEISLKV
jgi:hypothetical protein